MSRIHDPGQGRADASDSRTRQVVCIRCPLGCLLTVRFEGGEAVSVQGQGCRRGEDYARLECTAPTRAVTSSVPLEGGAYPMLPIRTASEIPKGKIMECMEAIKDVRAKAPVRIGDVIVKGIAGTGVDMIATRTIERV